jgi:hypothetical protein
MDKAYFVAKDDETGLFGKFADVVLVLCGLAIIVMGTIKLGMVMFG